MTTPSPHRVVRTVLWLAGLVAAAVVLRLAASGTLAPPPLTSPGGAARWLADRDPATAAVALVRLGAEIALWYVFVLSTVHVVAAASRFPVGQRMADAVALPGSRRLVRAGLGLGLAAATTVGADGDHPGPVEVAPVLDVVPVAHAVEPAVQPGGPQAAPGTAMMTVVAGTGPIEAGPVAADPIEAGPIEAGPIEAGPIEAGPIEAGPVGAETSGTARMAPVGGSATWSVAEGESLWSIAADTLEERWGRAPSSAEIVPFWQSLIEANRHRLVDPDDPDLILPGQRFEVPAGEL